MLTGYALSGGYCDRCGHRIELALCIPNPTIPALRWKRGDKVHFRGEDANIMFYVGVIYGREAWTISYAPPAEKIVNLAFQDELEDGWRIG
jgi:hypothetical protein